MTVNSLKQAFRVKLGEILSVLHGAKRYAFFEARWAIGGIGGWLCRLGCRINELGGKLIDFEMKIGKRDI